MVCGTAGGIKEALWLEGILQGDIQRMQPIEEDATLPGAESES
jgi:hypothetical protein